MADREPTSLLGIILAAVVTFAIFAPLIRRRHQRQDEELAKRVGKGGFTPLMYAASVGDQKTLIEILAAGVNVNAADENGETALMHAQKVGNSAIVDLLLKAGANPDQLL